MRAYLTIGASASGKSTWANNFISNNDMLINTGKIIGPRTIEINRDNIRCDLLIRKGFIKEKSEFRWSLWKWKWENEVTSIQKDVIFDSAKIGLNIIISDTNLNKDRLKKMTEMLQELEYNVQYVICNPPFDTLVSRDSERTNGVGISTIREQFIRMTELLTEEWVRENTKYIQEFNSVQPYKKHDSKKPNKPSAVIFDIDGTVAHMSNRSPYEWAKVKEDKVDTMMKIMIDGISRSGTYIIFMSGRDGVCYEDTLSWINEQFPYLKEDNHVLFMREQDSRAKDSIVKYNLFMEHVNDQYNVEAVFDDRPQVVRMWNEIGLKVWSTGDQLIEF
jgi:predicted kinase